LAIDYPAVLELRAEEEVSWTVRDSALYAMGVGLGRNHCDREELQYLALNPLRTLPSMAASLIVGKGIGAKRTGVRFRSMVHAAQRVMIPAPLPAEAVATAVTRISDIFDRGAAGAHLVAETTLSDKASGVKLARIWSSTLARDDGNFGGPPLPAERWDSPGGAPHATVHVETRPDQALLFRLSGDTNPLHADPIVAQAAGFPGPILQGLCTYGMACRALQAFTKEDGGEIGDLSARFSAPVYPGETVTFDLWRSGENLFFQGRVADRLVLKAGAARLI